jgi:hypothetical protein
MGTLLTATATAVVPTPAMLAQIVTVEQTNS